MSLPALAPSFLELLLLAQPAQPTARPLLAPSRPGSYHPRLPLAPAPPTGRAGRPGAPGPGGTPGVPFFEPGSMASGGAFGAMGKDAMLNYMLPTMSMMNMGRRAAPPDPNAMPAVKTMLDLAVPAGDDVYKRATAYGQIIAGMGGVRGMRGHSLKRLAGISTDSMMAGDTYFAGLDPFKKAPAAAGAPAADDAAAPAAADGALERARGAARLQPQRRASSGSDRSRRR